MTTWSSRSPVSERPRRVRGWGAVAALAFVLAAGFYAQQAAPAAQSVRFDGPTASQPLAMNAAGSVLVVVNPDNDSVSVFDTAGDRNAKVAEVKVDREPGGVAVMPDGSRAYVTNTISGTVSVVALDTRAAQNNRVIARIFVGTEPYRAALTPNGGKLYVTNTRSNTVSVIDTAQNRVISTISHVGVEPRGLAITNDGDAEDDDETVYVSQFLSFTVPGELDGEDNSKVGKITLLGTSNDSVAGEVTLQPIADAGFKAAGDAIARIQTPAAPQPADFKFITGAYPNQLNNLAIKNDFVYAPNTGASPNGPVRFDVNTQSLLHVIDRESYDDARQTINMHAAVAAQTGAPKLFITVPWAIAFKRRANEGFVVSAASNIVVKTTVDAGSGRPTVQLDPSDRSRVLQIKVGRNPRGIVINPADTRAYVANYVSRDVSVIDLTSSPERVVATVRSADLPAAGTTEDLIHAGRELYNTSVGEFDPPASGQAPIVGRMSNNGWGACSSCHPNGLTDNVVWLFNSGPRRTISQHADFDPSDPQRRVQRMLNWTAERDEEEDFELNIRAVSGGQGIIVQADGVTPDPNVANFTPLASAGRNQLKIRGFGGWDAIRAFEKFGIRSPISPVSKSEADVVDGELIFRQAGCQTCHGGPQWTRALVNFTPPPDPAQLTAGQFRSLLREVGTVDLRHKNEIRATGVTPPLGLDGIAPPSLLSLHAFQDVFLHNGGAPSLDAVLDNVTHRGAGSGGVDTLGDQARRRKLVRFLLSIDAASPPIQ